MRFVTGFVGAMVEALQEVRVHRTRVLLSLVGVAVAVCALATVVGLGGLARQANVEMSERSSGRPASLFTTAYSTDGSQMDASVLEGAWRGAVERYGIDYASRVVNGSQNVQFAHGVVTVPVVAVDQPYGTMHRVQLEFGAWFAPTDGERLAPALVVNEIFWQRMGSPPLDTHPTITLRGENQVTAVIIGVNRGSVWETEPTMFMLAEAYAALGVTTADPMMQQQPSYETWVPPDVSEQLMAAMTSDISAELGDGVSVDIYRQDYAAWGDDPFLVMQLVVGGIAVLVLFLGALGLVNIALVTVKHRIREIGVRRSFGATAPRVFFSVMMESVVGTVIAGVVGVMLAVLIVKNPWIEENIGQGMIGDFPPFPVEAAIIGLVSATLVGAIAGLLPALVAVRVKVIDAIRY